ncbi:MAG TPA: iron chelate uptake ABC transporter family permease subunit [Thermomicrobiales bacterium]|nr:iron chelate uptake ABC transporter family permease subunit [Thermomicrobiales bacterium]
MATFSETAVFTTRPGHRTFRLGSVALRLNVKAITFSLVALAGLSLLMVWAITLGAFTIPFPDVIKALMGNGTDDTEMVVRSLRLPRILAAVLAGAALAMSGAIFQGISRNPLVSPDIIGIDSGATLFAVVVMIIGVGEIGVPLAAFAGAVLTAFTIYVLSWKHGLSMNRLILVGIGVGAVVDAGSTYMTVKFPIEITRPAIVWAMGSFYAVNWDDVVLLAGAVLILGPIAVFQMESLRTMQFGDLVSRSLGMRLEQTRLTLIVIGCALAAVCVSLAGPIGFVALIVPHMARMLLGAPSASVLMFTAVLGALLMLISDTIAQHYLPVSLPVGVVTGAVGAPYFLFLLYRSNSRS